MEKDQKPNDPAPNYLQEIVYAIFLRACPSVSDVEVFAEKHSLNFNTLRDFYYKRGKAGISTINEILSCVLALDDNKVEQIITAIANLEPLSEADRLWNSIDLPADKKVYYAQVARAVYEIDRDLESGSKG